MISGAGKLIVIEGLEGAGKSTAVNTVINLLSQRNIPTITTREPGGTPIGEALRTLIKSPEYSGVINDKTELLLLYAARIQLVEEIIKPALYNGTWVVADRFELSTLAYQGGGRGLDPNVLHTLSTFCMNGFVPDCTLYLDITPKLGMHRAHLRGSMDRIEQQSIDFFERVHQVYIQHVAENPDIVCIDASMPLEEVTHAIEHALNQFIENQ